MYEELVRTENENNKDYFTRAAAYIKKLKDAGKEDEVSEAMRIVMEWLAPIMMQHIECEIVANDLDEKWTFTDNSCNCNEEARTTKTSNPSNTI